MTIQQQEQELLVLRRALDQQLLVRLQQVEERLDELNTDTRNNSIRLTDAIQQIAKTQDEQMPTLTVMSKIVQSGMAVRWMVMSIVGLLGLLATIATAWEIIKKWIG